MKDKNLLKLLNFVKIIVNHQSQTLKKIQQHYLNTLKGTKN